MKIYFYPILCSWRLFKKLKWVICYWLWRVQIRSYAFWMRYDLYWKSLQMFFWKRCPWGYHWCEKFNMLLISFLDLHYPINQYTRWAWKSMKGWEGKLKCWFHKDWFDLAQVLVPYVHYLFLRKMRRIGCALIVERLVKLGFDTNFWFHESTISSINYMDDSLFKNWSTKRISSNPHERRRWVENDI